MPGQWLAAATSKAATARRFVKAIASQHASGAMWRLPGQTRPSRGLRQSRGDWPPVRCPSGTANSSPMPARLAAPVPRRTRRPFTRALPPRGGKHRAVGQGWLASCRPVRERVGEELERQLRGAGVFRSPERVREMGTDHCRGLWGQAGIGGQATGQGGAARGGGCRVSITSGRCRARARGWRQVRALARRDGVDDDAATHVRRLLCAPAVAGAMVTRSRLQGLRSCDFGGSMPPRIASWSLLAHRQCGPAARASQRRNSPIGEPMAKGPRIRLGLTGRCSTSGSERDRADWLPAPGSDIRDALQVQPQAGARFAVSLAGR
jgi:hypothetical protein